MTKRTLTSPGEGTGIETDGTVLQVSTTATHEVDTLRSELRHGRLTTHLELSLLDVDHDLSTGQTTLMTRITANTYTPVRTAPNSLHTTAHIPIIQSLSLQAIKR